MREVLDPKAAFQHLNADRALGPIVERIGLIEDLKFDKPVFHDLCRAIVSQQLSGKASETIYGRFMQLLNCEACPHPECISKHDVETLRSAGLSRAKAMSLLDLSEKCMDGTIELDGIHDLSDEDVVSHLIQVKGVGRWTAEMILMFSLGRPDVLPILDQGIRNGIKKIYGLSKAPSPEQMIELAESWRPHRTIACLYIWRSLDS